MSALEVVVVGAGAAGTAAAWACAEAGLEVTVVHDRAGSTVLYAGTLDGHAELDASARAFVEALGVWALGTRRVATREGITRETFGADRALLDLAPLAGLQVAVADIERDDWDGPLLVSSLADGAWSRETRTSFSLVPVAALRRGHERRLTSHDFGALHDDAERLDFLARLLREADARCDAWLLGPWLGTTRAAAERLRAALGVPVGETTSNIGGVAGARFGNARDALFDARRIAQVRGRLVALERSGETWTLRLDPDSDGEPARDRSNELSASAVILATGGVAAGGIVFQSAPARGAAGFRLAYAAPVGLSLDGDAADRGGSLYGPSLEVRGLGALERVGVRVREDGSATRDDLVMPGLFVAGDALAARPRTVCEAIRSGIVAGRGAAGNAPR